ncbi:MAG: TIGR00303 family protein [Campylobacterales bacterium]|nr:TIGR00303 family protein [Campylobacterales bacterium]
MIKTLTGKIDFAESLRGQSATFILSMSNTKTANIEGITQAGIPGMLHLTPTLDAEFLCTGEVRSLENIATTPKGVPTPALITRAVHLLHPFGTVELLNLGIEVTPKVDYFTCHDMEISGSDSIDTGANIDALTVFQKGLAFGQSYTPKNDYVILGESVPSGTTTALATALALGYACEDKFSSSFKNAPHTIKKEVVESALKNIDPADDLFTILSKVSDNMLIFNAGFILGANDKNTPIVLAGGTQMACVLLVVNRILEAMEGEIDATKISLCTTKWVAEDPHSDIQGLLEMLSFPVNSYYTNFDFSLTAHPALKLYDEGEAKEGVGAGGALMYGVLNGLTKEEITRKVESFLG